MESTPTSRTPAAEATGAASVTVVIPTRDRRVLLSEAVASVEAQTSEDWQILIVDDASQDDTWSWISSLRDPRIRGIKIESHGERCAARNRGLEDVGTPYVLFLDDDDRLRPDALARLTAASAAHPEAVVVVGGIEYFDDEGRRLLGDHTRCDATRNVWQELVFEWAAETGRTLFRTDVVRAVGGFAGGLVVGEDRDLLLRLARVGPAHLISDVVLDHRIHPGQWRPPDTAQREREITSRHLATLPEAERRVGERIMHARVHYVAARAAWSSGRPRAALRSVFKMRRAPLRLLASPVLQADRMRLRRATAGALIGEAGVRRVRGLLSRGRSVGEDSAPRLQRDLRGPSRADLVDVTVVITTRNRLALMQQAVASVREQTHESRELIVVDDASDDATPSWIDAQPDIRAVHLERPSERSVARNAGAEIARGRYLMFLDDDDRLRPEALSRLIAALESHPEAFAAVGSYEQFDDEGHRALAPHPRRMVTRSVWNEVVFGWVGHQGRALFRTDVFRGSGGFVSGLEPAEDRDLWMRLALLGPVVLIPDVVMDRRVHAGNHPNPDWESFALEVVRRRIPDLPEREQRTARRIVDARVHYSRGLDELARRHRVAAAAAFVRVGRAPELLLSPLFRQQLRRHLGRLLRTGRRTMSTEVA